MVSPSRSLRARFYLYAALVALLIAGSAGALRRLLSELPPMSSLEEYTPSLSTRVYDRRGEVLAEFFTERRELLSLSKIPVDMQNAVIAVEDDNFFHHWGVSPKGIFRAALRNLWAGRVAQGGSTITQQLSKLVFLTQERTMARKIREVLLALQIERNFSKQEILQTYLNQVYLGHGAYGVQSAAMVYFGKPITDLNLAECAMLAGLIRSPAGYSPFEHPDKARGRRAVVLQRMLEEGFINQAEKRAANALPIPTSRPPLSGSQAPYFVEMIRRDLEPRYGVNALWKGGMEIHTTLDLAWQKTAERVMEERLKAYDERAAKEGARAKARLEEGVDVSSAFVPIQGAFVLMDAKTGAIRALIGGRDYKQSQFNRAVQANRQPGSSFKPFVWAAALESGLTAATTIADEPLAFYNDGRDWRLFQGATDQFSLQFATAPFAENKDFKIWVPGNFDGRFMGTLTLRRGLELSRNMISIRLVERVGAERVVELAHRMGIRSRLDPFLSLGLGTYDVSPLEMAGAYSVFANGGTRDAPFMVVKVADHGGKILEEHLPSETAPLSPQVSYLVTNMLKGVVENGTGRAVKKLGRPVAGKTGTTQDNKDLWFVGFTPELAAAAWMGYDDNVSLGGRSWTGGGAVAPWWESIMAEVVKEYPARDFPVPDGIVFVKIDADTGLLALPSCPHRRLESFLKGTEPARYCDVDHSKEGATEEEEEPQDLLPQRGAAPAH